MLESLAEKDRAITNEDLVDNYYDVKEKIQRKPSQKDIKPVHGKHVRPG